jgi:hypothetical protein
MQNDWKLITRLKDILMKLKLLKIKHQQVESWKPFKLCYLGFWTSTNFLYFKKVKSYILKKLHGQ